MNRKKRKEKKRKEKKRKEGKGKKRKEKKRNPKAEEFEGRQQHQSNMNILHHKRSKALPFFFPFSPSLLPSFLSLFLCLTVPFLLFLPLPSQLACPSKGQP